VDSEKKFSFLYVGDAQNLYSGTLSRLIRQGSKTAPDAKFIITQAIWSIMLIEISSCRMSLREDFIHSMLPSHAYSCETMIPIKSPLRKLQNHEVFQRSGTAI